MQFVSDKEKRMYIFLFFLGIILLFLRSIYIIITPSLYAEDGTWTALIINNGFLILCFMRERII